MKILLANYRWFVSGGPERYLFNVKAALEERGHEIIPFSVRYKKNLPTAYDQYFAEPLAGDDSVYFDQQSWSLKSLAKTLERSVYSPEVERKVRALCRETKPDVAYVLHYLKKLSPSMLVGLKKEGVPIVVRNSDFLLVCPGTHCLRDGNACTLCIDHGTLRPSLTHRCVKGSLAATWIHYLSTQYHRLRHYFDLIDRFVLPSSFTRDTMIAAGWPAEKLVHLPSFINPAFMSSADAPDSPDAREHIVYAGHLDYHKGADLLLKAYAIAYSAHPENTPRLIMLSGPQGVVAEKCHRIAAQLPEHQIEWPGFLDAAGVQNCMLHALFTVIPSRCFENMPQSIIESYACATPVLAANHGSLAPLVDEKSTGRLFEPGNVQSLAQTMVDMWTDRTACAEWGRNARRTAKEKYHISGHVDTLLQLLNREIKQN